MAKGDKRASEQKEENIYKDGTAKKKTVTDLSTFKTNDVQKWTKKKGGARRVSSGGKITFGGSKLGTKMRLQRKKNNRSTK